VDLVLKLVIEGGCLLGVGLLSVVSTPLLTDKVTTRDMAIRMAVVISAGLVYVFINPKGGILFRSWLAAPFLSAARSV
jgi:hypothetical protein